MVSLRKLSNQNFELVIKKIFDFLYGCYNKNKGKIHLNKRNDKVLNFIYGFSFDILFINLERLNIVFKYSIYLLQDLTNNQIINLINNQSINLLNNQGISSTLFCLLFSSYLYNIFKKEEYNELFQEAQKFLFISINKVIKNQNIVVVRNLLFLISFIIDEFVIEWKDNLLDLLIQIFDYVVSKYIYQINIYTNENHIVSIFNVESFKNDQDNEILIIIYKQIYHCLNKMINHQIPIMFPKEILINQKFNNTFQNFMIFIEHFVITCPDVNKSLSTVGFTLNICDYIRECFSNNDSNCYIDFYWKCIFKSLSKILLDYRGAIRKCAGHTILSIFQVHDYYINVDCYFDIYTNYIFHSIILLLKFSEIFYQNTNTDWFKNFFKNPLDAKMLNLLFNISNKENEMILHHSRSTFSKQWIETYLKFSNEIAFEIFQNSKSYFYINSDTNQISKCLFIIFLDSLKNNIFNKKVIENEVFKGFCNILNIFVSFFSIYECKKFPIFNNMDDISILPIDFDKKLVCDISIFSFNYFKHLSNDIFNCDYSDSRVYNHFCNFQKLLKFSHYWIYCWDIVKYLILNFVINIVSTENVIETQLNIKKQIICQTSICIIANTVGKIIEYIPPETILRDREIISGLIAYLYDNKEKTVTKRYENTKLYLKVPTMLIKEHLSIYYILKRMGECGMKWELERVGIMEVMCKTFLLYFGKIEYYENFTLECKLVDFEENDELKIKKSYTQLLKSVKNYIEYIVVTSKEDENEQNTKISESKNVTSYLTILMVKNFICSIEILPTENYALVLKMLIKILREPILNRKQKYMKNLSRSCLKSLMIIFQHYISVIKENMELYEIIIEEFFETLHLYLFANKKSMNKKSRLSSSSTQTLDEEMAINIIFDIEIVQFISLTLIPGLPNLSNDILMKMITTLLFGFLSSNF